MTTTVQVLTVSLEWEKSGGVVFGGVRVPCYRLLLNFCNSRMYDRGFWTTAKKSCWSKGQKGSLTFFCLESLPEPVPWPLSLLCRQYDYRSPPEVGEMFGWRTSTRSIVSGFRRHVCSGGTSVRLRPSTEWEIEALDSVVYCICPVISCTTNIS